MKLLHLLTAGLLLGTGAQAANVFWGNNADANNNWTNAANWGSNPALPGDSAADNALITAFTTLETAAQLNTSLTFNNTVNLAIRNNSYLSVEAGANAGFGYIQVGANGGTAYLNQTGGSISGTWLQIGTGGTGEYLLSGTSSLSLTGDTTLGAGGVLSLTGSGVTATLGNGAGDDLLLNEGGLVFGVGAAGASTVDVFDSLTIDSINSLLSVDATGLDEGVYDLVTFSSVSGAFGSGNITITGLGAGLSGNITYDADSMNLSVIPEPATLGLIAAAGMGLLFIRRVFEI